MSPALPRSGRALGAALWTAAAMIAASVALSATPRHAAQSPAAPETVRVEPALPVVRRHVYDPKHPPAKPPRLSANELGVCETEFGCSARFRTEWTSTGAEPGPATLTAVTLVPRVVIDVWTVTGSSAAVAAHEETHRRISEHYYALAPAVARRLGAAYVGRKVPFGLDHGKLQPSMMPFERELITAFMTETSGRCQFAQERFDALTDHARNSVSNEVAMRQALAEEAEHWEAMRRRTTNGEH